MTVEATVRTGGRKGMAASSSARRGPAASMWGEWKACETRSRRASTPWARARSLAASTAASSPEITVRQGEL